MRTMTVRKALYTLLFLGVLFAALALAPSVRADDTAGGGISSVGGPTGGIGGGGILDFYGVYNLQNHISIPKLKQMQPIVGNVQNAVEGCWRQTPNCLDYISGEQQGDRWLAQQMVISQCGSVNSNGLSSSCFLLRNGPRCVGGGHWDDFGALVPPDFGPYCSLNSGYEWHDAYAPNEPSYGTVDGATGFIVRVWRLGMINDATGKLNDANGSPVFERSIDLRPYDHEASGGWGGAGGCGYSNLWYFGGICGDYFSNTGQYAGMLSWSTPQSISGCLSNANSNANALNGLRYAFNPQDDKVERISETTLGATYEQQVRPSTRSVGVSSGGSAGECYWEGPAWGYGMFPATSAERQLATAPLSKNQDGVGNGVGLGLKQFPDRNKRDVHHQWLFGSGDCTDCSTIPAFQEALALKWNLPHNGQAPQISYKLRGVPGVVYAIQIVVLASNQQILPFSINGDQGNSNGEAGIIATADGAQNYLRVFEPNPFKGCSRLTCEPRNVWSSDTEPLPTVSLRSPQTAQARQQTTMSVSITTAGLTSMQALFPYFVRLQQFTPQTQYDGGANPVSSYPTTYSQVDGDTYGAEKVWPSALPGPKAANGLPMSLDFAGFPRAPQAGGSSLNISDNAWNVDYLRPTLQNPCQTVTGNQYKPWPANPSKCRLSGSGPDQSSSVRDAWDDFYSVFEQSESRWVPHQNWPAPYHTFWQGALLRCDTKVVPQGQTTEFYTDYPGQQPNCPAGGGAGGAWWPLQPLGSQAQQYAQGYLYVARQGQNPNDRSSEAPGQARIMLRVRCPGADPGENISQNCPAAADDVISAQLQTRDQLGTSAKQGWVGYTSPVHNIVSGNPELNFCTQGVRPGDRVAVPYRGSYHYETVPDSWTGDRECRGWDLAWQWKSNQPALDGSHQNSNPASCTIGGPPSKQSFRQGSGEGDSQAGALSQFVAAVYGAYGSEPGAGQPGGPAYNGKLYRDLPPVSGLEPGAPDANDPGPANNKPCQKWVKVTGHYQGGYWALSGRTFQALDPTTLGSAWNADRSTACAFTAGEISIFHRSEDNTHFPDAPNQAAYHCAFNGKYAYGYWYRDGYTWNWDKSTCSPDANSQNVFEETGMGRQPVGNSPTYGPPSRRAWAPPWGTQMGPSGDPQAFVWYTGSRLVGHTWPGNHLQSCTTWVLESGYTNSQGGFWTFGNGPEPGWGKDNTGPELTPGQYEATFTFQNPTFAQLTPGANGLCVTGAGFCWKLTADYDTLNLAWNHQVTDNSTDLKHTTYPVCTTSATRPGQSCPRTWNQSPDSDTAILSVFGGRQVY